jgi:hypothetical protein
MSFKVNTANVLTPASFGIVNSSSGASVTVSSTGEARLSFTLSVPVT